MSSRKVVIGKKFVTPLAAFFKNIAIDNISEKLKQAPFGTVKVFSPPGRSLPRSIGLTSDKKLRFKCSYCKPRNQKSCRYSGRSKWSQKKHSLTYRSVSYSAVGNTPKAPKSTTSYLNTRSCIKSAHFSKRKNHTCRSAKIVEVIHPGCYRFEINVSYCTYDGLGTLTSYNRPAATNISKMANQTTVQMKLHPFNSHDSISIIVFLRCLIRAVKTVRYTKAQKQGRLFFTNKITAVLLSAQHSAKRADIKHTRSTSSMTKYVRSF